MEKIWKLVWLCVVVLPLMATGCSKDDDEGEYSLVGTTWVNEESFEERIGKRIVTLEISFINRTESRMRVEMYYTALPPDRGYSNVKTGTWEYTPPILKIKDGDALMGKPIVYGTIEKNVLTIEGVDFTLQ
jgi:hypothetical protein